MTDAAADYDAPLSHSDAGKVQRQGSGGRMNLATPLERSAGPVPSLNAEKLSFSVAYHRGYRGASVLALLRRRIVEPSQADRLR